MYFQWVFHVFKKSLSACKLTLKLCVDGRISDTICRSCCIPSPDILCLEVHNVGNSRNAPVVTLVPSNNDCESSSLKMFKFSALFKSPESNSSS